MKIRSVESRSSPFPKPPAARRETEVNICRQRAPQNYTWPGSNWRPSACEADVIATRPQVLCASTQNWPLATNARLDREASRTVFKFQEKETPGFSALENRMARAAPGIEPGTSRTLSENHATRPSSQMIFASACHLNFRAGLPSYLSTLGSAGRLHASASIAQLARA